MKYISPMETWGILVCSQPPILQINPFNPKISIDTSKLQYEFRFIRGGSDEICHFEV